MKRISKTGLLVWLLLLAVSCTRTEVEEKDLPPHPAKEVEAVFSLNVLANRPLQTRSITFTPEGTFEIDSVASGMTDSVATKSPTALTEGDESMISQLWVGQYDASGNRVFSHYISPMVGTTVNLRLKGSGEATHHVWFVANCDDLGEIATETVLKEHVFTYASTAEGLPENRLCGMTGMWSGVIRDNGVESIGVDMIRTVAKISFSYLIGGDGFSFKPSSVKLKSVPDKMRMEEMTTQLTDVMYGEYTGEADANGATIHWYLPENRAGEVTGENASTSEKEKTGRGVSNATCIELTGTAVQGGVTYENVTFRFFPGSKDMNDYNIKRNHYYTMSVTLKGIDVTDQRITVGTIPPIDLDGLQPMPAGKGGTTELQVTARPGNEWTIKLPNWLSALLNDNILVGYGANITHQGPAKIVFKAETANPTAQQRSFSFQMNVTGEEQNIEIVQNGSTINVGSPISLEAASGSEGQSTFTLTKGLNWRALLSDGWLSWASGDLATSGDEATGEVQSLIAKAASSNPYASARTGSITVEGGEIGKDTGLKKTISVSQVGSTVQGSEVEVEPEAADVQSSSFIATPGLAWRAKVTNGDWISLSGTSSGNLTTGNTQTVSFDITVNPTVSQRSGVITVWAGDETGGPTGKITINQKASSLTASGNKTTLVATADDSGTLTYQATKGLPLSISNPEWLTLTKTAVEAETATGGEQTLEYRTSSLNLNGTKNKGNISVTAGEIIVNVTVEQEASVFSTTNGAATIAATGGTTTGSVTATPGVPWTISPETSNGITVSPTEGTGNASLTFTGITNADLERTGSFTVKVIGASPERTAKISVTQEAGIAEPYVGNIEVQKTNGNQQSLQSAQKYCTGQGDGWRLPSIDELSKIYAAKKQLQAVEGFAAFVNERYWSNTPDPTFSSSYMYIDFSSGYKSSCSAISGTYTNYVRCVRNKP